MKANLESRKSVRINWFKQKNVSFIKRHFMEWSYHSSSVENNNLHPQMYMQYVFSGLKQPVPGTNIIIFSNDLPQAYMKTSGSIGDKFMTEKNIDLDLKIQDRIIEVKRGEEKITSKPVPPHESHIYKEIQIHERKDEIRRKISIKNETPSIIKNIEITLIATKEIIFISSNPEPFETDPPEYKWKFEIPPEGTKNIELILENFNKNTYKIQKEEKNSTVSVQPRLSQVNNQRNMDFE